MSTKIEKFNASIGPIGVFSIILGIASVALGVVSLLSRRNPSQEEVGVEYSEDLIQE